MRLIDIINPLNWIIGWIAGDDVTFWTIVMVVFSDWMGLAAFALIICWGMILVNKGLEISYLPKLIGDLLTLPVLILFMVWQYKYFEEFFYGIPNYYVLYSVGLLAWLFACFAPSDFLDD